MFRRHGGNYRALAGAVLVPVVLGLHRLGRQLGLGRRAGSGRLPGLGDASGLGGFAGLGAAPGLGGFGGLGDSFGVAGCGLGWAVGTAVLRWPGWPLPGGGCGWPARVRWRSVDYPVGEVLDRAGQRAGVGGSGGAAQPDRCHDQPGGGPRTAGGSAAGLLAPGRPSATASRQRPARPPQGRRVHGPPQPAARQAEAVAQAPEAPQTRRGTQAREAAQTRHVIQARKPPRPGAPPEPQLTAKPMKPKHNRHKHATRQRVIATPRGAYPRGLASPRRTGVSALARR